MKTDPYYQRQNVGLVSGNIRFMRIFAEIPRGRGVKRQWDCRQRQFSSETLEMRPALLYNDTQSVVRFSVIPKCMTLNDLQWLFRVKFSVWLAPTVRLSKNNCVKTIIKIDTYCQRRKSSAGTLVSGNITFM